MRAVYGEPAPVSARSGFLCLAVMHKVHPYRRVA
jgi:hypothetical protein